jgi:hypothetical protein
MPHLFITKLALKTGDFFCNNLILMLSSGLNILTKNPDRDQGFVLGTVLPP